MIVLSGTLAGVEAVVCVCDVCVCVCVYVCTALYYSDVFLCVTMGYESQLVLSL
jgi:hypothetical protein